MQLNDKLLAAIHNFQNGNFAESERMSNEILQIDPRNSRALNLLGMSLHERGLSDEGIVFVKKATEVNPNYHAAHNNLGTIYREKKRFELALPCIDLAISLNPASSDYLLNRASVLVEVGDYEKSLESFEKAILLNPELLEAYIGLGKVFLKLKCYEKVFAAYDKALALKPDFSEAWLGRGNVFAELTQYNNALAAYDRALTLKPALAEAWLGRGNIFVEFKQYENALAAYERALTLKPDLAEAWLGRGNIYAKLKQYHNALAAYDRALTLKSDLAEAWLGRGNIFLGLKQYENAFAAYDRALTLKSDLAEAWLGRGNVFNKLKRPVEAASAYAKVLEIDPQHPFIKGFLLHQKMLLCEWKDLNNLINEIDSDLASGKRSAEPFGYQAIAHSARNFKLCAEIYGADRFPRPQTPLWRGEQYDNSKIRVGYLSSEFRNHVVCYLMAGLFELHDKNCFEIFAFDNGQDDGSDIRGRINQAFNSVVDISHLDDFQAAATIKNEQIDILVNLNGYFGDQRTGVFSYKPSPIQVNYLGFTATMGVDYIDYIIADRFVIPPEHKTFYAENVVYLPDTYQVNDSKRPIAERTPTRAEVKLPDTGFIFCCFCNSFKITPEVFDVWMRLLNGVENSVLWLTENNPVVSKNLRVEARHRHIAPERLVFAPPTNYSDYLAKYRVADLFLDTLPFNGGATASDALWAGLPVVTCSGQPFTARMAGSLLNAVGLPELITKSLDEYEALALKLARNPALLTSIKEKLTRNRDTYPLFDTKRFTRHIESAYTTMWERSQRGEPPISFSVDTY